MRTIDFPISIKAQSMIVMTYIFVPKVFLRHPLDLIHRHLIYVPLNLLRCLPLSRRYHLSSNLVTPPSAAGYEVKQKGFAHIVCDQTRPIETQQQCRLCLRLCTLHLGGSRGD